ncbi:signal peptidase II [Verrucomicrobiales bacterium]|nr:signal peptidase II [Verrucomicrobiales bacterium]
MKLILLLTLPLFVLDFITKEIVVRKFDPPSEAGIDSVPVIDGFFNLVRLHNTGIAFGHFNGEIWANILFTIVAVGALVYLAVAAKKGQFLTRTSRVAAALLASGILGNLLDRLMRGYVVDFLDFIIPFYGHWPSFNVADSCICIAAALLFISAFQKPPDTGNASEA